MSNVVRPRIAHQVFDKVTKRVRKSQTSSDSKIHFSLRRKRLNLVDPFEYFNQNDIVKSWTSKLSSLVRDNRPQEAIDLFKKMLVKEQGPNFVTVLSVIKAVGLVGSNDLVKSVHGYSLKMGFLESEVSVVTALVGVYTHWDMGTARELFGATPNKDVILCSAMVSASVCNGNYMEAFKLLKEMVWRDMQPNYVTIASILPACADLAALKLGREIHGYSIKRSFHYHTNFQNSVIDMYSKCRHLEQALKVFQHKWNKDIISWRIMLRGCVENESPQKAFEIFYKLRACSIEKVDEYIIQEVITTYSQLGDNYIGHGFHSLVLKMAFTQSASVITELLQVYAKFGDIGSARHLFDQLKCKDIIAWSALIGVYSRSTQPSYAFDAFQQMQLANQRPNEFTFVNLLLACTSVADTETGGTLHALIIKYGYSTNTFLTSGLIDMYCKFGRMREGKAIFDENPSKLDFVCWSSMINGYGINGCGEEVLDCFSNMLSYGIVPNNVIFISILSACSHCGLEYEGWNWFHAMETEYGIKPELAHYACMVDMLSRQGNIEEALEFVNNMDIEPDKRIWGAILAGCRNTDGNSEILEFVAKKLIGLDPGNSSYYVVLSNLYADQGRWEEVENLRNVIDSKSLKKVMGYSTV